MRRERWWILGLLVGMFVSWEVEAQEAPVLDFIDGWGWAVDPDGDSEFRVDDDELTIVAPGPVHDLSAEEGRMNAPRTARRIEGDFIAQVKVSGRFDPGNRQVIATRVPYHGAGLVLMGDLETYVWFARSALVRNEAKRHYVVIAARNRGRVVGGVGEAAQVPLKEDVGVYLRIERRGNLIRGAVALEPGKWHDLAPMTIPLPDAVWIGLSGVSVSGEKLEACFERFEVFEPTEVSKPEPGEPPEHLPPGARGEELPPRPGGGQRIALVN